MNRERGVEFDYVEKVECARWVKQKKEHELKQNLELHVLWSMCELEEEFPDAKYFRRE